MVSVGNKPRQPAQDERNAADVARCIRWVILNVRNRFPVIPLVRELQKHYHKIAHILQQHGVWDIDDIASLMRMEDSRPQQSIAALCKLVDKELSNGTVFLSDLWDTIQDQLGYYNAAFCGYLLGFVLRFYVGRFTWHDGSNPFKLEFRNGGLMDTASFALHLAQKMEGQGALSGI